MSHSLDRDSVIRLNYFGLVQKQQSAWNVNSPFHDAELFNTAVEYDTDKANMYLDRAGLDKRDRDGWRLRPDGKRLELNIVTRQGEHEKDLEIYIDNLKDVGLYTNMRTIDWGALMQLRNANQLECTYGAYNWGTNEGMYYQSVSLGIPYNSGWWCPLWTAWMLSAGARGEEPIPEVMAAIDAYCRAHPAAPREFPADCCACPSPAASA